MGKKAIIFIIVGLVFGVALTGVGVYFIIQNGNVNPEEEKMEIEEYDVTQGKRLSLEKVQIPLATSGSKNSYLQADFTIIFKTEEALNKANEIIPDIKAAIYSVFETKTAEQLKVKPITNEDGEAQSVISPREAMREPVLNSIRNVYSTEEDKENIVSVVISSFMVV